MILAATSVNSPLRLQTTTYSPHVGIILSWSQSATPSGVSQYKPQSVFVQRLPNSPDITEEGNLPEPIRTSHNIAHTIGLPKPTGYNLEWPRVTPIQVTLITRPTTKHRIKTFIQSRVESSSQSNSTPRIAWRLVRIAWWKLVPDCLTVTSCRHALSSTFVRPIPPSRTTPSARCHAILVASTTVLSPYRLAACPASPGAIPVTYYYWFLTLLNRFSWTLNTQHKIHIINHTYQVIIIWPNHNSHIHLPTFHN